MLADEDTAPKTLPPGFSFVENEPVFDPDLHLALEAPQEVLTLQDFGYSSETAAQFASPIAATSPIRFLSDEGIATMQDVLALLKPRMVTHEYRDGPGGRRNIYYGQYQSRFLRDLMACPQVVDFLSDIFQTPLAPHTMAHLGCQINYSNEQPGGEIIGWHHDIVGFTVVITLHDPSEIKGGHLMYYKGPRDEGQRILNGGEKLPEDKVVTSDRAPMGYALVMQGSAVLNAVQPVQNSAFRCSVINAYVSRDVKAPDANRGFLVGDFYPGVDMYPIYNEMARHAAWLAKTKLSTILESDTWIEDREQVISNLSAAVDDVQRCIKQLKAGDLDYEQNHKNHIEEDERQMTTPLFEPGAIAAEDKG
jgi:hypothetical protein